MGGGGGFFGGFGRLGLFNRGTIDRNPNPMDTVGLPGFKSFGGFVVEDERSPDLTGEERYRTFSDMLANTSMIAASVRYFLNLLAKSGWNVEPSDPDSAAAKEMADWMWDVMNDMETPWRRVVRRAGMFPFHGFSVQEWTAKRREDGSIGLLDIEPRPQITIDRWDFDDHGRVIGMVQRVPQNAKDIYLPRGKVVYLVDDAISDTPIGLGLFRHLVDPWKRLKQYELLEAYSFEANLRGIPVVRAPLGELDAKVKGNTLSADKRDAMVDPVRALVKRHFRAPGQGYLFDSATYRDHGDNETPSSVFKWGIELIRGDNQGQPEVAQAIERLNRDIAVVLGTEGLLLGNVNGTQALSRDKSHTFSLRVESTQGEMAEGMEKDIRDPLWELNAFDPELRPRLVPDPIQFRDPETLANTIESLARAGATLAPDDPVINVMRSVLGLPEAPSDAADLLPRPGGGNPSDPNDPDLLPEPRPGGDE